MRALPLFMALGALSLPLSDASAWEDEDHLQVAAVAYYRLTPDVRAKVDALIKLNPFYDGWTAGWPSGQIAEFAFVRAATWPDDIKSPGLSTSTHPCERGRPRGLGRRGQDACAGLHLCRAGAVGRAPLHARSPI